jgi:DNA-binding HxlR family transcriptional regulator
MQPCRLQLRAMLRNDYENQSCSIAGALEVVGERWSLLIVRDILLGLRRFDELQSHLGIARNILQTRLTRLQEHGVIERVRYQEHPPRHEYLLTDKGLDLWPTVVALMKWGDRYAPPDGGPAVLIEHRGCGGAVDEHRICERCGARLNARDALGRPGPGASPEHPLVRRAERNSATTSAA